MVILSLLIQAWAALSDEAREARQTQDRIHTAEVRDDDVDEHAIDADVVHVRVLNAGSGEGS